MPAIVTVLAKHIDVIGMVKKSPKFYYQYNGYVLDLMAKQHLNLAKEIQCRDFDALIAHTTIVFMRYMFLAYQCRIETDHKTSGDLFYCCCDEVNDISFIEAL